MAVAAFLATLFLLFSTARGASPPKTSITFPTSTYAPGTYNLPSTALPPGISIITLTIDRTKWLDPKVRVTFKADLSSDGGKTWFSGNPPGVGWCAFPAVGGVFKTPTSYAVCSCNLNDGCDPANATLRVRGFVTIVGGSLTVGGSIVAE